MSHLKAPSSIEWKIESVGEGETLLFLHGWGVDRRIWRQQVKYFAQYYHVVTLDLPGHGESTFKKIGLAEMASDVKAILFHLKIHQMISVGSSLGGLVALKLYEIHPAVFKRMVFVGSMPKFAWSAEYPHGLDIAQIRKLDGQLDTAYPSIVDIFFRSLFTRQERESRRFHWIQVFRQQNATPLKKALSEYLDILEQEDLREVLKKIKLPIQFVNGKGDQICTQESVMMLRTLAPHARFHDFEHCGHFPFLSNPKEFNQVLEQFLKG
jgi:pimeloyl-[acyl-carrier protein] methyl ester esterase